MSGQGLSVELAEQMGKAVGEMIQATIAPLVARISALEQQQADNSATLAALTEKEAQLRARLAAAEAKAGA